ncbi:MAG: Rieske 2Fe-2S domain-containing protein [Alphaproteobacteria bacterium]|nr:Rieske 2Fe-2S domain-containing protein [Alphaproteobacteria bacterium]
MGVVSSKTSLAKARLPEAAAGYHRAWYPVCLSRDLPAGKIVGRDLLGSRLVAYRDAAGKPVVQTAWCPHLGADLSLGQLVDGHLRCPYHHWSFDTEGRCARIPTGDRIPSAARIFTYPTEEAWGLVWAFNGEQADTAVPRLPGADEGTIAFETDDRGERPWDTWIAISNGVDFQHLRTLHGIPEVSLPEHLEVNAGGIEFRIEGPYHLQHGRISGTNVFAQHLRMGGRDMFMLFAGTPIAPGRSTGFRVIGVPKDKAEGLADVRAIADRLGEEDAPVLKSIRFRRGLLTASDRHLARYFKYVEEFPCFAAPEG